MKRITILILVLAFATTARGQDDAELRERAMAAMAKATAFFRQNVATNGGYLWTYSSDLTMRRGEGRAYDTTIWVQPPGTPAIGLLYLDAFDATGDSVYFQAAQDVAGALVWGQLSTGGWDYRIDFDPERSKRWHYRRDVEAGDTDPGERGHRSVLDDNTTQEALRLLMRVDKRLGFADEAVHGAALYGLEALLKLQYPNGAWPQLWTEFPDPSKYPVLKARYPESWPRVWPEVDYREFYTFNDNAMADVIDVMIEASHSYGAPKYRDAAMKCGDFMLSAQMPDPQPTWAQQYNHQMEPAWARRFEPASVTGGESFGVMNALIDLYTETGEERFIATIPKALAWATRSLLPDGRLARFYELKTNKPLYFVRNTYELVYSDADMPTHYAFKVAGKQRIESVERRLVQLEKEGLEAALAARKLRWGGTLADEDREGVKAAIASLDDQGRWVEAGQMPRRLTDAELADSTLTDRERRRRVRMVETEVIRCRTFLRNMRALARFVVLTK